MGGLCSQYRGVIYLQSLIYDNCHKLLAVLLLTFMWLLLALLLK